MSGWRSFYIQATDPHLVAEKLFAALDNHEFKPYDPFPGGSGTPIGYKTLIRQFVSPAQEGWVRVLGELDPAALPDLSQETIVLSAWLNDSDSGFDVYQAGRVVPDGLVNFLRSGANVDHLHRILQGALPPKLIEKVAKTDNVSALPDEIQKLARDNNVNVDQANRMFNRLTSQIFGKMDKTSGGQASALQNQAQGMVNAGRIDWNGIPGRRLIALAELLTLPESWREPDFDTVREAYQVARMLRKNANATLMGDEKAALKALPNALDYVMAYVGK